MSSEQIIVIDNGSSRCRAGFAHDEEPKVCIPSVIGFPQQSKACEDIMIGQQALKKKDTLILKYPMNQGTITDQKSLVSIWKQTFKELNINNPSEHPVFITQALKNPKKHRENIMQIMFETFNVPKLYIAQSPIAALYSHFVTTGVVLDIGDGVTSAISIDEGKLIFNSIKRNDFGGRDLTISLSDTLKSPVGLETIRQIKEELCYVALDPQKERKNMEYSFNNQPGLDDRYYELPDQSVIRLGSECYKCPEALFSGEKVQSIHQLVIDSISECEKNLEKQLYSNIVLCGGCAKFSGLSQRLKKQINISKKEDCSHYDDVEYLLTFSDRQNSPWIGGCIMSSMQLPWITKKQYEQVGSTTTYS